MTQDAKTTVAVAEVLGKLIDEKGPKCLVLTVCWIGRFQEGLSEVRYLLS